MRIDKQYKPELCVLKDGKRPHLAGTYLSIEHKHIVATDGACLVMVPVLIEEGDTDGAITAEALKAARKMYGTIKAGDALEVIAGPTFPRPDADPPPYMKVIPDASGFYTFALDAEILWRICQALGGKKGEAKIKIRINTEDAFDPIVIEKLNGAGLAVLMPVKL